MKQTPKIVHLRRKFDFLLTKKFLKFSFILFLSLFISCNTNHEKKGDSNAIESKTSVEDDKKETKKRIVVFGDSLTAGYGLDDVNDAFPGVLQIKIDSLGLDYEVVNSGVSGETTAGGKNRIDWVLNENPDVFILELGGNDGLRGVPLTETIQNLQTIINRVKTKYPESQIVLTGMQIPPNLGQDYTRAFKNIFPDLAKRNNLKLIPFLLEGVGGNPELNQPDGIHPTEDGHKILAENVWKVLYPILK